MTAAKATTDQQEPKQLETTGEQGRGRIGLSNSAPETRWIEIPQQWQLPDTKRVERTTSWDQRLAALPEPDQKWLRSLNDRYAGALVFDSAKEQLAMIDQGFPMPEEWLAAQRLSDSELETLADAGNLKAQMFYIDRVGKVAGAVLDEHGGLDTTRPEHRQILSSMTKASAMNNKMLRAGNTPFAAYQFGQFGTETTPGRPPELLAGGLFLAGELGDMRTSRLQVDYSNSHPGMDKNLVTLFHSIGKRQLER